MADTVKSTERLSSGTHTTTQSQSPGLEWWVPVRCPLLGKNTVSSVTTELNSIYWYLHLYYSTPHPSCLKGFSFIYPQSCFHYLVVLSQQNQQKVNKSLSRRTGFIILCEWLKCLPPQCITNEARKQGIPSSLRMPDKVLNFVKDHFLMDSVIRSPPLLVKRNAHYTQIAVQRLQTRNKVYHVLFIGTGEPLHSHNHAEAILFMKRLSVTLTV